MAEEMGTVEIEGMKFTLFYDYDQLRDRRLAELSENGKIEWFGLRMEMVFLGPLRKIFNKESVAHKELNSPPKSDWPRAAVMTAAFSILLNGVEAVGSFLNYSKTYIHEHRRNKTNTYFAFRGFIQRYMKDWDILVQGTSYESSYLPEILWKYFRNGIAHYFVVKGGGIEYEADRTRWMIRYGGYLEIGPIRFFEDFLKGVTNFFEDAKCNNRESFLKRFEEAYPSKEEVTK